MPLKAFVQTLEEVPEALHEHYKQQDDGRWKFNAEDVEDVTGLKSALDHVRTEKNDAKEKLAEALASVEGIDLKLAKELLGEHEKGKRKKMIDEDRVEELITEEVEKRVGKMRETHGTEVGALTGERDKLRGRLEVVLIDNSLSTEATKAGVLPEALSDVVRRGRDRFHLQDEAVVAKDGDGNIMYGSDGKTSQSVGEFMDELKAGARHLFQPSKGGGAGRQFNSRSAGAGSGNENVRGVERMRQAHEQTG
jgi:hypothetical protein